MTNSLGITAGTQIYTSALKKPYIVTEQIADEMWSVETKRGTGRASVSYIGGTWVLWPSSRGTFPRNINVTRVEIPETVHEHSA